MEKRKIKNSWLYLLVLMILIVSVPIGAKADEKTSEEINEYTNNQTQDTDDENRIIKIGYIDFDGFISKNEDGTYSGYGVDYLKEIAKYTGWKYEYVYDTWDNQMKNLQDGTIDFVCQAQKTKDREENYLFSKYSDGSESNVLYVKQDNEKYYSNDFANLMD